MSEETGHDLRGKPVELETLNSSSAGARRQICGQPALGPAVWPCPFYESAGNRRMGTFLPTNSQRDVRKSETASGCACIPQSEQVWGGKRCRLCVACRGESFAVASPHRAWPSHKPRSLALQVQLPANRLPPSPYAPSSDGRDPTKVTRVCLPSKRVTSAPRKFQVQGVADMIASNSSKARLLSHSPGVCFGVRVCDPVKHIGGMRHLVLRGSWLDTLKSGPAQYTLVGSEAPRLFQGVYRLMRQRPRVKVKVAGGARSLDHQRTSNIGMRDTQIFLELPACDGHNVRAKNVGGGGSRTVRLELTSGMVAIHSPGFKPYCL